MKSGSKEEEIRCIIKDRGEGPQTAKYIVEMKFTIIVY